MSVRRNEERKEPELIDAQEFADLLGISKRTLFRLRSRGAIPPPVRITAGTVRWRTRDVRGYLDRLPTR